MLGNRLFDATTTGRKSCQHGANIAHIGFRCTAVCLQKQAYFRRHFSALHQFDWRNTQTFLKDFGIHWGDAGWHTSADIRAVYETPAISNYATLMEIGLDHMKVGQMCGETF